FAHGPAHGGRGVMTAVNTSALQWHGTNAIAEHARESFGDQAQGGNVGMPAIEVWGARGRERVIALEEASYVVGSDPESTHITLDDPKALTCPPALDSLLLCGHAS